MISDESTEGGKKLRKKDGDGSRARGPVPFDASARDGQSAGADKRLSGPMKTLSGGQQLVSHLT